MWPLKQIDFRINREQFEAFSRWMLSKFQAVHFSIENREACLEPLDIILHDHALAKITQSHLSSWRSKAYGKMYNYKLSPGTAVAIHEVLRIEGYKSSYPLEQFHERLYTSLTRYFSDDMLIPKENKA